MVSNFKFPIVGTAKVCTGTDLPTSNMGYEDVMYCQETMSYKTASQEKETRRLRNELEDKKIEQKKSLEDIISYFYNR